jgi:hypothetical protein
VAKKGGGREAMASVELRWRLGWYGWGGPCCGGGGGGAGLPVLFHE